VPVVASQAKQIRRKIAFWDRRHSRVFLGALIVLGAFGAWTTLEWLRPRPVDVDRLAPVQVWAIWQTLRQGPDRNLTAAERYFVDQQGLFRTGEVVVLTCGVGGLMLMAFGYATRSRRRN
jgi:hypothetical protein